MWRPCRCRYPAGFGSGSLNGPTTHAAMAAPNPPGGYRWFARQVSRQSGRPQTFSAMLLLVVLWLATGPLFGFSDTWQLVINTATTIITFLMVFVIQNTQNRDTEALQIKLDELIRATQGASDTLMDLEEMAEQQLDQLHEHYEALARLAREQLEDPRA